MATQSIAETVERLRGGFVVSCQPRVDDPGDPLGGPETMALLARAAERGGARAIRALAPGDVAAIAAAVDVPVIGLTKTAHPRWGYLITPGPEEVRKAAEAGARIVAIDATARGWDDPGDPRSRGGGMTLAELFGFVREETGCVVLADCATAGDAARAVECGADLVATTFAGYVGNDRRKTGERPGLVGEMAKSGRPVVAEGGIWTPDQARRCFEEGAWAVCAGSAVTRPQTITERFVAVTPAATAGEGTQ